MERQILLYGLGGADKQYGVLRWYCIYDQESIKTPTIASQYEFKDLLERKGIVVG